jgi:hypothetical protein
MTGDRSWRARLREVGDAFLGVVRAELAALVEDLGRSGKALVRALVLVAVAAGIAFWTLGLLLYFAIELVALLLPRWGAVGVVLGIFLLLTFGLLVAARRRWRSIEPPTETVRRRLDESRSWWSERIAGEHDAGDSREDEE